MLDPASWFWLPLVVAIVFAGLAMVSRRTSAIVVLRGISVGFVMLSLVTTAMWTWLLRDGLGPDAVSSTGSLAWRRFAEDFAFPFLVGVVTLTVVLTACRRRLRVGLLRSAEDDAAAEIFGRS